MVRGLHTVELSTILKNGARFFTFTVGENDAATVSALGLPEDTAVVCVYRDEQFFFAEADTKLREGDELVLLTRSEHLATLQERWSPRQAEDTPSPSKQKSFWRR
jgi:trk/ktr system potassium uptake protein